MANPGAIAAIPATFDAASGPAEYKQTLAYIPQLDGVRAFAVTFVILAHWFAPFPSTGYVPYGEFGVIIFFVLSGFLITTILLNYKKGIEQGKGSTGFYLGKFFKRRVLRIFPIYYLTIALVLILKPAIFEGQVWWHCAYLSNFFFVLVKHGWQQPVSQWWSLSVEEQFYLIWPFVIFFINRRYLTYCILTIIIIGPLYRYFSPNHLYMFLTPACLDALGCGALLALHYRKFEQLLTSRVVAIALVFLLVTILFFTRYKLSIYDVTVRIYLSLFSFFLIFQAAKGFKGIFGAILANPAIIYIGKISYGLYIYHLLILEFDLHIQSIFWLQSARIAMLLAIASVSYFFIEKPILRLKKYA
jgi:peptidoglycan/LPS O-acetylase OafA/YrhL